MPYREVTCTDCNGSGQARCMGCDGGYVKMPGLTPGSFIRSVCVTCRGTGYFTCLTCHGTGTRQEYSSDNPSDPNDSKPKKRDTCSSCDGTGWKKCSKCGGSGQLRGSTPAGYVGMPIRSICDSCYGRGRDTCSLCNGTGYR